VKNICLFTLIVFMYFVLIAGCDSQVPSEGEGMLEENTIISGPPPNSREVIPDGPG